MSLDSSLIPQLLFVTGALDSRAVISRLEEAATDAAHQHANELFLSNIHIDRPILQAATHLLSRRQWQGVHFAQCTGLVHGLIEVACASGIHKLSLLCEFRRMETSWCRALGKGLQHVDCKVQKLILQAQLSTDLAKALYEGLNTSIPANDRSSELVELSLPLSETCWQSILLLSASLQNCKSLKKLSLNRHDLLWTMDDSQVITLMKALRNNLSLKELFIQGSSCHQSGIEAISEYILAQTEGSLEKLDLSNHRFGIDHFPGMKSLSKALETNCILKTLSLSGHRLTPRDVTQLAESLANPGCRVQEVCLTNCNLTDECISILASQLQHMRNVRSLWIHDNPFTVESAQKLVDALEPNMTLRHLVLPTGKGKEMEDLQLQVEMLLTLNRAGRRLLWTDKPVPPFLWAKVLERAGNTSLHGLATGRIPRSRSHNGTPASAIYQLLHEGPISFER